MAYIEQKSQHTRISLYTTLPVLRWKSYEKAITSWHKISSIDITILVSQQELISHPHQVAYIKSLGIACRPFQQSSMVHEGKNSHEKLVPSLPSLLYSLACDKSSSCLVYCNADIYLSAHSCSIFRRLVDYVTDRAKVVFVNRWDVSYYGSSSPIPYTAGFDMFLVPSSCRSKIIKSDLSAFFIGQVGWDYALPLSLDYRDICKTSQIPLQHLIHPTTSTQSWSAAMLNVFSLVHKSHIQRSSLSWFSYSLLRIIVEISALVSRRLPSTLYPQLNYLLNYLNARLVFYGFIDAALSSIPELNDLS